MKKIVLLLLLCTQNLWAIDSKVLTKYEKSAKPQVVRAYYTEQQQIQALSQFKAPWEINASQKYAVLSIDSSEEFKRIVALGFTLRIDTKLQQKVINDQAHKSILGQKSIPGYACYSTVEETFTRMETLAANYPAFTEIIDIGDSWEKTINVSNGYDMRVLKITNENVVDDNKPILFLSSAIHAREYATAELNTRFAEYLLDNYATNSDIKWMLDYQEIHFLLHTNPDGRKKAETGILWRKNTNEAYCAPGSDSRGADLNRNYPFQWVNNGNQCGNTYSGPSMNSEPEVDSLVTYLRSIYDDNRGPLPTDAAPEDTSGIFVDIHSYSQLILWPWGYIENLSPNANQFAAFGKRVANFNDYVPEPASSLYTVTGASIDTSYGELGVASLVYELGTAFFQDCAEFESKVFPDNLQSLLYVSRVTRTPYITPLGPDIENLQVIPNVVSSTEEIKILGVANDDKYNHSNGVQPYGQVQNIEYFINALPWETASGAPLTAVDGAFNSAVESFTGSFDAFELNLGENIVYTVATDNDGKRGAVFSQFVNFVDTADVGTLSGLVTDAVTGMVIENVQLEINQSLALSDNLGNYTQLVYPTTATLKVESNNYVTQQIPNITIIAEQTLTQNIQLEPYCEIFSDDIENGVNFWQAQSPWGITQEQAASGNSSWTDSPNVEYANNVSTSLTSGDIDITDSDSVEISFNHLCDTESGFDYGHLEVNIDNSAWQEVFNCNGSLAWKSENQAIVVPSGSQSMKVRFKLTSDTSVTRAGWFVDDIVIKVSGAPCHFDGSDIIFANGFE